VILAVNTTLKTGTTTQKRLHDKYTTHSKREKNSITATHSRGQEEKQVKKLYKINNIIRE
jgi:hypothetical protein